MNVYVDDVAETRCSLKHHGSTVANSHQCGWFYLVFVRDV